MTASALLLTLAALGQQSMTPVPSPEKGWSDDYSLKVNLTYEETEVTFQADLTRSVAVVNEDGSFVIKIVVGCLQHFQTVDLILIHSNSINKHSYLFGKQ